MPGWKCEGLSARFRRPPAARRLGSRPLHVIAAEADRLAQRVQVMIPAFVQLTAATNGTTLEGTRREHCSAP